MRYVSINLTFNFLKKEIKLFFLTYNRLKHIQLVQNPDTKDYIMVLYYTESGSFKNWIKRDYAWHGDMNSLKWIIAGLGKIHEKVMVHRDFHIGNILFLSVPVHTYISDMGLCGNVGNVDTTNI